MDIQINYNGQSTLVQWSKQPNKNQTPTADISSWPKVLDQVRGYFQYQNNQWCAISQNAHKFKRVALIVESPHKDEFDNLFNPIAPLNGRAGKRFAKAIMTHLNQWFSPNVLNGSCIEIKIFNPIQYQTSLYHFLNDKILYNKSQCGFQYTVIDAKMRNAVWKFLYLNCGLNNDFVKRLQRYKPAYIVNCCTGKRIYRSLGKISPISFATSDKDDLKGIVRNDLYVNKIIQNNYIEDVHPCVW